jgi:transcriptional regulator with XRE-family HTH domain
MGLAADLGPKVRAARHRRRWSQRQLGERVGLSGRRIGHIENGRGTGASIEVWCAIGVALDIPLKVDLGRDRLEDASDAGHLKMQELALRVARRSGRKRSFELPTRPADPALSVDVLQRDDALRVLLINECWNSFGNINASVRSTRRKIAEAEALAVAVGGERGPYRVAACWIVRDTRRNRELLARYPEVFASTFSGSSVGWVRALTTPGVAAPVEAGLVWCDREATRLFAWRQRS